MENKLCRVDQMPDAVNPGENVLVRHNSTLGIKTGTARGWPRRSRTAEASHIRRSAMKLGCAREWGGWGRLSDDGRDSTTRTGARAPGVGGAIHRMAVQLSRRPIRL